jgi:hypothetical protein
VCEGRFQSVEQEFVFEPTLIEARPFMRECIRRSMQASEWAMNVPCRATVGIAYPRLETPPGLPASRLALRRFFAVANCAK